MLCNGLIDHLLIGGVNLGLNLCPVPPNGKRGEEKIQNVFFLCSLFLELSHFRFRVVQWSVTHGSECFESVQCSIEVLFGFLAP